MSESWKRMCRVFCMKVKKIFSGNGKFQNYEAEGEKIKMYDKKIKINYFSSNF